MKKPIVPAKQGNKAKANKTSFKPGQSGNPQGRPPSILSFRALLIRKLEKALNDDDLNVIVADELTQQLIDQARKGSFPHLKEVIDRVDGKPPQPLRHGGDPENSTPITVETGVPLPHAREDGLSGKTGIV